VSARAIMRFRRYATLVKSSAEGTAFRHIAIGLGYLWLYLVLVMVLGRIAPLFIHTDWVYPAVFVKNHLPVLMFLLSSIYLYNGSVKLVRLEGSRLSPSATNFAWLAYLAFAAVFSYVFYMRSDGTDVIINGLPAFSVAYSTLLFTLILPSLVAWALCLFACLNITVYARNVKGVIYKSALKRLSAGILASAAMTVLVELLILNVSSLQKLGLNSVLIVLYGFLLAYGAGSVFLAQGARKLALIEETQ
jgi:hypothetical protein